MGFRINLTPQLRSDDLTLEAYGNKIKINGDELDFSTLPEGATVLAEDIEHPFVIGDVSMIGGNVHMSIILPHVHDAPEARRFPTPLVITGNGAIELPENVVDLET